MKNKEWFATWFDTAYYHLLYRDRNEVEARQFIDALLHFLSPDDGSHFIDVACGKGRHSVYLHSLGYDVTGIDLSENSIEEAKAESGSSDSIRFVQHDIRKPFPVAGIDYALNLFTSFGYFDTIDEHITALKNIKHCLTDHGKFAIDYLNTTEVLHNLRRTDQKIVDGVEFEIKRYIEDGFIIKSIDVNERNAKHHYEERVRAFSKDDLYTLLQAAGFEVHSLFGDYQLKTYTEHSPRVIIVAENRI